MSPAPHVCTFFYFEQANYQALIDTFPEDSQGSSTFESLTSHHIQQVCTLNRLIAHGVSFVVSSLPTPIGECPFRCLDPARLQLRAFHYALLSFTVFHYLSILSLPFRVALRCGISHFPHMPGVICT